MINLCIVHYNTPELTDCLIKSINKFTPNCTIYIFDNSDKFPFTYKQDNLIIFDNTKGQIINFDKWLNTIHKQESCNNWVSAKHCYTIQKCIELINEPFILLDSDVLLKKDISALIDYKYICTGSVEKINGRKDRLVPFVCFINTDLCKKHNISYFNVNRMVHVSNHKIWYDTGASFLEDIIQTKEPINFIRYQDYIVHYGSASWNNTWFGKRATISEWLNKYKMLYE